MKKQNRFFMCFLVIILVCTMQGSYVLAAEIATQTASGEMETQFEIETAEDNTDQEEENHEEENQEETVELSEPKLGFVYAKFMELDIPGTQSIALVFDEVVQIESPKVRYRIGENEDIFTMELTEQVENVLLFEENYTISSQTGIYKIIGFSYEVSGVNYEVDLKKETCYSVGERGIITENDNLVKIYDVDSLSAMEAARALSEASIIEVNDELSISDITEALANVQVVAANEGVTLKSTFNNQKEKLDPNGDNLVIVLASGYCANHNEGAEINDTNEGALALRIAEYAKEELETYAGVTVYLSQTDESCTWGTNLLSCLKGHADYAASVDADVLISLSVNSADTVKAKGLESVITLQSSYYIGISDLNSSILEQLGKVGLSVESMYTTDADAYRPDSYAEGQFLNEYSVIKESVYQGIPAFILEHPMKELLNQPLFNSEESLKTYGIIDATGIANYYGLKKNTIESPVQSTQSSIQEEALISEAASASGTFAAPVKVDQKALVTAFVTRLYKNILGRTPNASESAGWVNVLVNKKETGAQVVMGFINSPEFTSRGVANNNYVEILYKTMFDRASDSAGKAAWVNLLDIGMSRYHVASGFTNSNEFDALCKVYGINRGTLKSTEPRDQEEGYTRFVSRLYTKALGRKYEVSGLNAWTNVLLKGTNTYEQVAENFIFSAEFVQKRLNNTEYVKVLYRTFLDREPAASEVNAWVNAITNGQSRSSVLYGFSRSTEFQIITGQIVENKIGIVIVNGRNMHSQYYTDPQVNERTLLAALICTEAGGESYAGQVAVGVVVLNRMAHSWYPNGLKENVYLENQFQVARITIPAVISPLTRVLQDTSKISQSCWKAADAVLAMKNSQKIVPGIKLPDAKKEFDYLFFMTPAAYENTKKDGDEILPIGNHIFFNRK